MAAKLGVVEFFGTDANIGYQDVVVGMDSQLGRVNSVSGLLVYVGSGNAQTKQWVYDHQLQIQRVHAQSYGWPTGVSSQKFSHSGVFPSNNIFNVSSTSGFTIFNGSSATTFGR